MKDEVKGMVLPESKENQKDLLSETKETLATDLMKSDKNLSVAEVWNIQKKYRPMIIRKWLN